jgi:hypothetical protein
VTTLPSSKNIVILSTEPWGKMLLSKMHYAIELAEKGHRVFFVNPPAEGDGPLVSQGETLQDGKLTIIHTRMIKGALFFRHKFFPAYKLLTRRYVNGIRSIVGEAIDEVWSFNPHVYVDLRAFKAKKSILLIYDFYKGDHIFKAAESADGIITISSLILDYYRQASPAKLLLQHGLGKHFEARSLDKMKRKEFNPQLNGGIKVGYVGNLLRVGMNTEIARQIIVKHPEVEFHFWGPSSLKDNNVNGTGAGVPEELVTFIKFLESKKNVVLHGVAGQEALSKGLSEMDVFLFLYSPRTEMNSASNAHKLLEYLSTGKVTVSTHVSNYAGTDLLVMCEKEEEESLPLLFDQVVGNLPLYNAEEQQRKRIDFALDNTYSRQIDRIRQFIHQ